MDPPLGKLVSFQAQAKLAVPYCKETTPGPASWCVTVNVQDTSTVDIWHFLFMSSVSSNIFFWWLENVVRYSWLSRLRLCTDMYLRGEAFSVLVFFFFFLHSPWGSDICNVVITSAGVRCLVLKSRCQCLNTNVVGCWWDSAEDPGTERLFGNTVMMTESPSHHACITEIEESL